MVWWGNIHCHMHTGGYHRLLSLTMRPVCMTHSLYAHKHGNIQKSTQLPGTYLKHGGHATQNSAPADSACPRALSHKSVFMILGRWGYTLQSVLEKTIGGYHRRYNQYDMGCGLYVRASSSPLKVPVIKGPCAAHHFLVCWKLLCWGLRGRWHWGPRAGC